MLFSSQMVILTPSNTQLACNTGLTVTDKIRCDLTQDVIQKDIAVLGSTNNLSKIMRTRFLKGATLALNVTLINDGTRHRST